MAGTKNTLGDMYNILAAQLERLSDDMSSDELETEIKRGKAMASIAAPMVHIAEVGYKGWKTSLEYGSSSKTNTMPRMLEVQE